MLAAAANLESVADVLTATAGVTEERALTAAGGLPAGGVSVVVRGGVYRIQKPLELTAEDSGTADAPIAYVAAPGEEVRLVGGQAVTGFEPVTDPAVLARLDESARGQVVQADLAALGVPDFGSPAGGGIELFFQDKPMTVARWPNEGFVNIATVA